CARIPGGSYFDYW
nr:immunoglobulin heavy chain junction region [Mus musculus]MBK4186346.1 immunoglobulin heavy chain junction region [Mus musculus]